ncbi:hypothetical protein F4860DRAFT_495143 [Xylaria cubensis]|nr:hypothetical protein F4860DRAFT_495143 [Xylaria cubensis]
MATTYIIDPNGDVIIRLRNYDAPFAVLDNNTEPYIPTKNPPVFTFGDYLKEPKKEPQSPSNGLGENTVSSEVANELFKTPIHLLQVSSAHLILASRYFKAALCGPFEKSRSGGDGIRHIDASDWDTEALLIVLRIIHGQNRQVPKSLDLDMLAKVAVVVDYYKCYEAVEAFVDIWSRRRIRASLPFTLDRDLVLRIYVSWVFRWRGEFEDATESFLQHSKGPLRSLNLPIPENIISTINERRIALLRKINSKLEGLVSRFRKEPPECSFECASMNLGALSRQIHNNRDLNRLGQLFGSHEGRSFASTVKAARKIRSPGWFCPNSCCRLDQLVKREIGKLENLDGLSLDDFEQAV